MRALRSGQLIYGVGRVDVEPPAEREQDRELRDRAAAGAVACAHSMLEDWLGPALPGGWHDHFSEGGKLISPNMPASSAYHVYFSVSEFSRVAGIGMASGPD